MTNIKNLFGKRIKELRKEKHLTQEKLAELIDIDIRNIIKIENGETFPRINTIEKLIKALEINFEDIFRTEHLNDTEILLKRINEKLEKNDNLVRYIYKILF